MTSPSLSPVGAPAAPAVGGTLPPRAAARVLAGYVAVLAAAELLVAISVPGAAVTFALLALGVCAARRLVRDERAGVLLPVLVAVPTIRLLSLAAPGADLAPAVRLAVLAVPTAVAVALAARGRPAGWGLLERGVGGWRVQAAIGLVAVPLSLPVYLLVPAPVEGVGLSPLVVVMLLAVAVVPDEVLYRGLVVPAMAEVAGRAAVPLAAATYAAAFAGYASVPVLAVAYGVGYPLAWLRHRTGSAVGVVAARILLVALVFAVLPALDPR